MMLAGFARQWGAAFFFFFWGRGGEEGRGGCGALGRIAFDYSAYPAGLSLRLVNFGPFSTKMNGLDFD